MSVDYTTFAEGNKSWGMNFIIIDYIYIYDEIWNLWYPIYMMIVLYCQCVFFYNILLIELTGIHIWISIISSSLLKNITCPYTYKTKTITQIYMVEAFPY